MKDKINKHTTGPWINDGDVVSAFPAPEESQTYIAPICTMDADWRPEIMAANARLIAAAPDLLEQLECAVRVLWKEGYTPSLNMVAAIAKARGEA